MCYTLSRLSQRPAKLGVVKLNDLAKALKRALAQHPKFGSE